MKNDNWWCSVSVFNLTQRPGGYATSGLDVILREVQLFSSISNSFTNTLHNYFHIDLSFFGCGKYSPNNEECSWHSPDTEIYLSLQGGLLVTQQLYQAFLKFTTGVLRKIKVNRPGQDKGMDNRKGNEYDSRGNVQIMQTWSVLHGSISERSLVW